MPFHTLLLSDQKDHTFNFLRVRLPSDLINTASSPVTESKKCPKTLPLQLARNGPAIWRRRRNLSPSLHRGWALLSLGLYNRSWKDEENCWLVRQRRFHWIRASHRSKQRIARYDGSNIAGREIINLELKNIIRWWREVVRFQGIRNRNATLGISAVSIQSDCKSLVIDSTILQ